MISLTLKEFALAVGADPKWVQNAKPRLGCAITYTAADAQWLRLTRTLNRDLRIPLRFASELARAALGHTDPQDEDESGFPRIAAAPGGAGERDAAESAEGQVGGARQQPAAWSGGGTNRNAVSRARAPRSPSSARSVVCVAAAKAEGVRLTLDLRRQRSTFAVELAGAIAFGGPRRAGRKRRPPAHYRAAIGRAWRLNIPVGLLRRRARRAEGARLERMPGKVETGQGSKSDPAAPSRVVVAASTRPMFAPRSPAVGQLGKWSEDDHSLAPDAPGGRGRAEDIDPEDDLETAMELESAAVTVETPLIVPVLATPRWCADLSAELGLPDAEARASVLRRLVENRVRFVVVGELAEALAGAFERTEQAPESPRAAGPTRRDAGIGSQSRPILDLCYAPTAANMRRLARVLRALGARPPQQFDRANEAGSGPRGDAQTRQFGQVNNRFERDRRHTLSGSPGQESHASRANHAEWTGRVAATGTADGTRVASAAGATVQQGAPFAADPITLRSSTALALTTSFGTVHVRRDVAGIGGFDDVRRRATRVRTFGLELAVLDLPALAHVRTATGTRGDVARLPMLETLLALPALEARHRELAAKRISWIDN